VAWAALPRAAIACLASYGQPGRSRRIRGVLEDVEQRHITVTNYCPILDRFSEKNPGYAPLIDSGNPGNWPKSGRNAPGATRM